MAHERPFYYHISDPIQHLSLRVSVRSTQRAETGGGAARRRKDPNHVTRKHFSWQEKAKAPWEVVVSGGQVGLGDELLLLTSLSTHY